ncbi:hypothetical protein BGX29_000503 [Mortierella sp. GBA35]|nr:hypothetical protein BGX29_000503 [Mortierella sp. GBA35]
MRILSPSWKTLLTTGACLFATASIAQADITCAGPLSGVFAAGDPISLSVSSDGKDPVVGHINSLKATLYCNAGNEIGSTSITDWTVPFPWTVPSVGNATVPGGTTGPCASNTFHISYSGVVQEFLIKRDFGPVACPDITITPAPNNTLPPVNTSTTLTTPPPTATIPTSTSTKGSKTTSTTTTTTSTAAPPTQTSDKDESNGKPATHIIVIVAIVAALILVLLFVGIAFHLRRQRRKRMEDAIMPWSTQPNSNQFSKMSSSNDDDDHRSPSHHHAAAAAAGGGAAAAAYGSNKPQPMIPQPSHGGGGGYYGADNYGGYGQQQQEEYYNPYYSQHSGGGGGYQGVGNAGAAGAAAAGGYGYGGVARKESYYTGSQGSRTPYQESHDPYQQSPALGPGSGGSAAGGAGYYPPPPVSSGATSPQLQASANNINSAPNTLSSTTLTTGSVVSGRAPQVILPEMGKPADLKEDGVAGIPMKDLPSSPR